MDLSIVEQNLLSPPILFFALGLAAGFLRSDLAIPEAVTKLLSLYLLWAIGFKGGVQIRAGGLGGEVFPSLAASLVLSTVVPFTTFAFLRRRMTAENAAALAAVYGSVSAVTFLTATSFLQRQGVEYGGHMVAALALMESPAIIIAVLMARLSWRRRAAGAAENVYDVGSSGVIPSLGHSLREAALNGPVVLLTGSLVIGAVTGQRGYDLMKPLAVDLFQGVLSFFLLELGLVASRRARDLVRVGPFMIGFGLIAPLVHAAAAIGLARVLGLSEGNAFLVAVLGASASYIAAPAAIRTAIPRARAGLYIPLALAVTFPMNVVIGLPLYWAVVKAFWRMGAK